MIAHYKLITVNHKVLNTEDLEHFLIRHKSDDELASKLDSLKKEFDQDEVMYISTCNRVIYFFYGAQDIEDKDIITFFKSVNPSLGQKQTTDIGKIIKTHHGADAVKHLMDVASSIDSLVVGEREIFRQVREAYEFARKTGLAGDFLRIVDNAVVRAAKDVYTNTAIGAKPVSVASLAVQEFLKRGISKEEQILLIGAGETNSTIGRFLRKHGYDNLVIYNRSLDNAEKLSSELEAQARYLGSLEEHADSFACVFACTASQDPIITNDVYDSINKIKESKLLVDLSIPHNVHKDVAELDSVDYISIDSIRSLAEKNLEFRSGNISAARIIISQHLDEWKKMYDRRRVERALSDLPTQIHKVKDRALNKVYKDKIESLSPEAQELISEIADYMEKKCVAVPMKMAKKIVT